MLTERRKADRAKMADAIEQIARELGATVTRTEGGMHPRGVCVSIEAARGLCVSVDFDGDSSQPDVFVLPWHMSLRTDACLANAFGPVNPHHFQKATMVAVGFDELCQHMRRQLGMAADGSAFDLAREAAGIAKNGTWQAREAYWQACREDWARDRAAAGQAA